MYILIIMNNLVNSISILSNNVTWEGGNSDEGMKDGERKENGVRHCLHTTRPLKYYLSLYGKSISIICITIYIPIFLCSIPFYYVRKEKMYIDVMIMIVLKIHIYIPLGKRPCSSINPNMDSK